MKNGRILITSVGSLVGWTLLAALHPIRSRLTIIGCNTVSASPTLFGCDRVYLFPKTSEADEYRQALRNIVYREKPDMIIPGRDEELGPLSELAINSEWNATRVLVPPPELVPVFNDKLETARFAARHGLPFAHTAYEPSEITALAKAHGFPLVVKPRIGGHASKSVHVVTSIDQLKAALKMGDMLVQECLNPGTIFGLDTFSPDAGIPLHHTLSDLRHAAEWLLDDRGEILSLQGAVSYTEGPLSMHMRLTDDAALKEVATAYARALASAGHRGVANIQGKLLADGSFVPFELNGRFTGSAAARAFLGCNQIAQAVCHYLWQERYVGKPVYPDTTVLRSTIYQAVDETAMNTLETTGFWSAGGIGAPVPAPSGRRS